MKFINSFKLFESKNYYFIKQDLEDILMEIKDMGYDPKVQLYFYNHNNKFNEFIIRLLGYLDSPLVVTKYLKEEVFDRIFEYLSSEGLDIEVKVIWDESDIKDGLVVRTKRNNQWEEKKTYQEFINLAFNQKSDKRIEIVNLMFIVSEN